MGHIGAGDLEHTSDQSNAVLGMAVRLALGEEGGHSRREAGRTRQVDVGPGWPTRGRDSAGAR